MKSKINIFQQRIGIGKLSLILLLSPALAAFLWQTTTPQPSSSNKTPPTHAPLVSQSRQITFEGSRSGEGYFNKDGSELIFQSERFEGNPFYQIYKLNLSSGKTELISTGKGQTTCAWIHPSGKKIMFSSTHLDPNFDDKVKAELALRKQPTQKYSWSFDEIYDIFEKDLTTGKLKNLTNVKGYDAEGAYSPDGQWIVFASNRAGYTEKLSEDDRKRFEADGSYLMDIYIMKADGSKVKRLTDHLGYDGGPFFSHDGKQITWRRFTPDGRSAEIFTMNVDGSDQKAVTHLNVMSWAPFFHPSGKYIIFTTNLLGFQNFELYIVDAKGTQDPVRVTSEEGFDGLPVFSPNGKSLAWTKRNNKGESQIYMADWDHQAALRALNIDPAPLSKENYSPEIAINDLKTTVYNLASKGMQGRLTGSLQEQMYSSEIAKLFRQWGLKEAPNTNNYIHEFEFLSNVELGEKNELLLNGKPLKLGTDWNPVSFSQSGELKNTNVVFAGYGLNAPATEKFPEYNSYKGLDVKDKWVLVFRDIPNDVTGEFRYHLNFYSRIQHKVTVAKNAGAKGLLIVAGPRVAYKQKLPKFQFEGSLSDTSLPVVNIDDPVAQEILKPSGKSLESLQKGLDDGSFQEGFSIDKSILSSIIDIHPVRSKGHSVLATINIPGAKETLFVGAHGDHLGLGIAGVSLATSEMADRVHYGADDNASGVAAVLELAHYLNKNRAGLKTNVVFAIWSGEELGNLGSKNYLQTLKTKNPNLKIKGYLNLDMVGRFKEYLYTQGLGSSKEWRTTLESLAQQHRLSLVAQDDPYLPTDAMSFYVEAKVPVMSFFTGSHMEYHTPLDTPEKINFEGLMLITQLVKDMVAQTSSNKLTYRAIESNHNSLPGRKFRVYLGTIPDYSQEGVKGVRISGTSEKSPAEKAGLKAQDVIVELSGQKIENLYDFTYALQMIKPGAEVPIKVMRQQSIVELRITPGVKE
jgi:Tol biopolymer transport system component